MVHRGRRRAKLLAGAAFVTLAVASLEAQAASITIKAQPLATALPEFGAQSGITVLASPDVTGAKVSRPVTNISNPEVALRQMLAGSGLTYKRSNGAYLIVRAEPQRTSPSRESSSSSIVQNAESGGSAIDALIVTAQKREENIQDVPIAISAFSQEDLTRSQIAGGPDLITQVPNMTFTKTNFSSYSVQLRGIGTQAISATTDPAVAVAFNNTPFIRNRFFEQEFYDLQRVEVLRGPQGTLYGRNATAGVVNIISAKPKFRYEAKASGDAGDFNSSRIEGMINIPLVEDVVALRLAGAWTKRDGYATNELTGNPIDGRDLWSTRVSLRVSPNDRLDANLIWEHFQENDDRLRSGKQLCHKDVVTQVGDAVLTDYFARLRETGSDSVRSGEQATFSQGCRRGSLYSPDAFQTPNGLMLPYYLPLSAVGLPTALVDPYISATQSSDLRVIESTIDPTYRADSDIAELQVSFDLSDTLTLSSETSYAVDSVYSMQDFNRFNTAPGAWRTHEMFGDVPDLTQPTYAFLRGALDENGIFCDPQLGCSDRLVAVDISTAKARQFSQEIRLASDFDGAFNFSLGANYLRSDSEDKYYVFINSLSLITASGPAGEFPWPTYAPNVTDNSNCLNNGYMPGDPNGAYPVIGCVYMDPNPIESVNDEGHNYFLSKNPYKLVSYAIFGEIYYQISDALKLTGGLRWTVDKKDAPRVPTWILATQSVGYPVAEVVEQEWSEPTGRLTLDWKPDLPFTDDTMIYASYAHGYKAGGANPPGFVRVFYADRSVATANAMQSATRPLTFDAEFVDAMELGTKNTLADGKVTLNLAAFYYDYTDYQISEIVDRSAFNRNFDAEVWGVEVEADWRPLENLRLGFKGGYEKTRIKDGEQAIDLMDRTAGDPNWTLTRPFPTFASSCILPTWIFNHDVPGSDDPYSPFTPNLANVGGTGGGNPGGCELAYIMGVDPVTRLPYVEDPTEEAGASMALFWFPGEYPGWDPSTAPNGGEGIMKDLGGNELPNAPNWTATVTADYAVPLPNDWLATLHTDLHWQSESYWRVFQDHDFSTLDEYFTMNLAAIFTNEERGWNIMAYVKNVTDETAITGAFLNSDDTGLTTNVFLTEPRLYGLRVTKNWAGGPLLGSFGERRDGPSVFTLEVGGQAQRHDAPNTFMEPEYARAFEGPMAIFDDAQDADLDWGQGGEVRLTWQPLEGPWSISAGWRAGETNGYAKPVAEQQLGPVCGYAEDFAESCVTMANHPQWSLIIGVTKTNHAQTFVWDHEKHEIFDLSVGKDLAFAGLGRSHLSVGLRHATLQSSTDAKLRGVPDWVLVEGFWQPFNVPVSRTVYDVDVQADREFEGFGPVLTWEAALPVANVGDAGAVDLEWSVSGGVLFGDQETSIAGAQKSNYLERTGFQIAAQDFLPPTFPTETVGPAVQFSRRSDATVPTFGASLGLSYKAGAFKVGAGYRWERYIDAIDGGFEDKQALDRTIDGPYFKVAIGFGG